MLFNHSFSNATPPDFTGLLTSIALKVLALKAAFSRKTQPLSTALMHQPRVNVLSP